MSRFVKGLIRVTRLEMDVGSPLWISQCASLHSVVLLCRLRCVADGDAVSPFVPTCHLRCFKYTQVAQSFHVFKIQKWSWWKSVVTLSSAAFLATYAMTPSEIMASPSIRGTGLLQFLAAVCDCDDVLVGDTAWPTPTTLRTCAHH